MEASCHQAFRHNPMALFRLVSRDALGLAPPGVSGLYIAGVMGQVRQRVGARGDDGRVLRAALQRPLRGFASAPSTGSERCPRLVAPWFCTRARLANAAHRCTRAARLLGRSTAGSRRGARLARPQLLCRRCSGEPKTPAQRSVVPPRAEPRRSFRGIPDRPDVNVNRETGPGVVSGQNGGGQPMREREACPICE